MRDLIANDMGNAFNSGTIKASSLSGLTANSLQTDFINTDTGRIEGGGPNGALIFGSGGQNGNTITNSGEIVGTSATTGSFGALRVDQASGLISNTATGVITSVGGNALRVRGSGNSIVNNAGLIENTNGFGLNVINGTAAIENTGRIIATENAATVGSTAGLTLVNRAGAMIETTTTSGFAGIAVFGGPGTIMNEAGATIQATGGGPNAQGIFIDDGSAISLVNAGLIDAGAGRGVDFNGTSIAGFENTGMIRGGENAVEVSDLNGQTLYNRAGGVIETRAADTNFAGVAVFGGSGAIMNEAGATIAAPDGTDGQAAIFVGTNADLTIDNFGVLRGDFAIDASFQSASFRTSVTNSGLIDGDIDLGAGDDALSLLASGEIVGASDGGEGTDVLSVDVAGGATRMLDASTFTGFETITLNGAAEASGAFVVGAAGDPMTTATLDAGGAGSSITLERGALALIAQASSLRAEMVTARQGTLISGNGTVFGTTHADGMISPGNSVGELTFDGALNLSDTSVLVFELGKANMPGGALNDLIVVTGDLTLDGGVEVSVSAGGTLGVGTYRLIDYTGTLSDMTLDIASLPAGASGMIDISTPNQVNLIIGSPADPPTDPPDPPNPPDPPDPPDPVDPPDPPDPPDPVDPPDTPDPPDPTDPPLDAPDLSDSPDIQFWDGANLVANNVVDGGTLVWNATNTNWTTATGGANAIWDSGLGTFAGATGIVTVVGLQAFEGLEFVTGDYQLVTGAEGALSLGAGAFIGVAAGLDATIDVALQGPGALDKQGAGRLILNADSSYAGGTLVSAGTLGVGADRALGTGGVSLANGTVLQAAGDGLRLDNAVTVDAPGAMSAQVDTQDFALTLAAAVTAGDDDRLEKAGQGRLVLGAGGTLGGFNLLAGTVENHGALSMISSLSMGNGLATSHTMFVNAAGAMSDAGTQGIIGDAGAQTVETAGAIVGDIDLGGGQDRLRLTASGTVSGASEGGTGSDLLQVDAASAGRTISQDQFTGFETISFNATPGAAGGFVLSAASAPALNATLDTGGAAGSSFTIERGELALVDQASSLRAASVTIGEGAMLSGVGQVFTRPAGSSGGLGTASVRGLIAPGNGGIGTLQIDGNYAQSGRYALDFRAPSDPTNIRDGALWGRNVLDQPGLAAGDADADLIRVAGAADLSGGSIVLQPSGPSQGFADALAAPGNTAGQLRYLVLRAEAGLGASRFVALSDEDVSLDYVDGVGDGSGEATDVVLVVSGEAPTAVAVTDLAPAPLPFRPSDARRPRCDLEVGGVSSTGRCAFGSIGGAFSDRDQSGIGDASSDEINGLVGLGRRLDMEDDDLWLGFALGYGNLSYDADARTDGNADRYEAHLWSTYLRGPMELRGWFGYTDYDISQSRDTDLGRVARSDQDAYNISLSAEGRYWFDMADGMRLAPVAGLAAGWFRRDGYTERDAGAENFRARRERENSLRSRLAVEARWLTQAGEMPLLWTGRVGWLHEFSDTRQEISGVFLGDATQTELHRNSPSDGRDFLDLGLSLGVALNDRASMTFGYDGALGSQLNVHNIGLRFSSSF